MAREQSQFPGKKPLAPGEIRFVPRERKLGRNTTYEPYDRALACVPGAIPGYGIVRHTCATLAECEAECAKLEQFHQQPGATR